MEVRYGDRRDYLLYAKKGLRWLLIAPILPVAIIAAVIVYAIDLYCEMIRKITQ